MSFSNYLSEVILPFQVGQLYNHVDRAEEAPVHGPTHTAPFLFHQ
jgi:hypothetical protein